MVTNELLSFIQTRLNEGASRQEIESVLMSQGGWSKEDVDEAFNTLSSQSQESAEEAPLRSHSSAVGSGQSNNSRGIPTSVLIGGGVVLVGVILFFVLGPVLGMRYNAPNDIEGFLADFIESSQEVESFSYDLSLSVAQEPRDESAEPFDITDPLYEERIEDVEGDIELLNDVASVAGDLRNYEWSNDSFPTSLAEVDISSEIDINALDYQRTEGGSSYDLKVQVETEEMFDYLTEDLEEEIEGERTSLTVTLSPETGTHFYLYYSTASRILHKNSLVESLEALNMTAISLPSRFNSDISFSGMVGLGEEDTELPDTKNSFSANVDWGDLTLAVDADALIKDQKIYARVNRFPSIFFFDIEPIRERWINIPKEETSDSLLSYALPSDGSEEELFSEFPRLLSNAVSEHNPFVLDGSPQKKELEGGRSAFGYNLDINADNFPEFYEVLMSGIVSELRDEEEAGWAEEIESMLEHDLAFFEAEEFTELVEYLNENVDFTIWMDERTGYPIQYSTEIVFVPNPAIVEDQMFFGPSQASKNTQLRLISNVTLSDINQRIDIQAPDDPLTFDEAAELMFGSSFTESRARGEDALKKSSINQLRSQAELYYSEEGLAYTGFCSSDDATSILEGVDSDVLACNDSSDAWAAEVELSDGSFYCADSTGFAGGVEESTAEDYRCD